MFELPTIMINFKTYEQASGANARELATICEDVSTRERTSISCCVQAADINGCNSVTDKTPVFSQHVDSEPAGGHTGKNHIKALVENGAVGSLVNHSEDRISIDEIEAIVKLLDDHDMLSVVCVKDATEASRVAGFSPDIIAIEPPELIGGDVSVTSANPDIITSTIEAVQRVDKSIPVLCGAGVKTGDDVRSALELGAKGVLIASGVAKAVDQRKALLDLVKGVSDGENSS